MSTSLIFNYFHCIIKIVAIIMCVLLLYRKKFCDDL